MSYAVTWSPLVRAVFSMFFSGLGLVFLGLSVLMAYEAVAVFTRQEPTISLITSYEFLKNPVWWVTILAMLMFALGALVTHFTHWTP